MSITPHLTATRPPPRAPRSGLAGLACLAAWLLPHCPEARGQQGDKPVPMPGQVTAVKGEPVTIELVSDARTRASVVEFLIRDFPLNGTLGPLVSHGHDRTRATVRYTAHSDSAATTDSFTFAARYPDGLWSGKAKVDIRLQASEPLIHASTEADFGKVMLGQSEEREIFLSNGGTAPYRHQLQLSPPWTLVSPPDGALSLPVGGQQTVKVRFSPETEGPATYQITFFRNQGAATQLRGAGYAPFAVEPVELVLRWEEGSRTRLGSVSVTGFSPRPLAVGVQTDDRLKVSGSSAFYLNADEPAEVQVYLPPSDTGLYGGALEIAAGGYRVPVAVRAEIAPAYLVVENTGSAGGILDFGSLEPGGLAQASFQLRNAGGSPARIQLGAEAPFTILAAGGRATLDPQEAEAFAVRVSAPEGIHGLYESVARIQADNGQAIQIPLRAVFLASGADASASLRIAATAPGLAPGEMPPPGARSGLGTSDLPPDPSAPGRPATREEVDQIIEQMDQMRSPLGFITVPLVERAIDPAVPPVPEDGLALLAQGRRHLTVAWPAPGEVHGGFELEMRMTRLSEEEDSPLESVWAPYHDVAYTRTKDGGHAAEIRGLSANSTYEFRLFTVGQDGAVSEPLAFAAKTEMPLDWTWIYVSAAVLLLGGAGYLAWKRLGSEDGPRRRFPGYPGARGLFFRADPSD